MREHRAVALELAGRLVSLRDFTKADGQAFADLADDEAMFEFMRFRIDRLTVGQTVLYLLQEPQLLSPRRTFNLAVIADGEFVGWAALGGMTPEGQAEFGWYLRSDAWGRGFATEATSILLRFAFEDLTLKRLIATADPENLASIRVLTTSGLADEGSTAPVETWRGIRPRVLFSIDETNWRSNHGETHAMIATWHTHSSRT